MSVTLTDPEKEEIIEDAQEALQEMADKATEEYKALKKEEEESKEERKSYLYSLRF